MVFPPLPTVTRGNRCKIDSDNSAENIIAYCNTTNVLLKSLSSNDVIIFDGHKATVNVARFSPCKQKIASADMQGNVIVWIISRVRNEKEGSPIVYSQRIWPGAVNDLEWNASGTQLLVVGEGATVIDLEKKSSNSSINIHSRPVNCVSWRTNVMEACTASDDFSIGIFRNSPFALQNTLKTHTNFVQVVRYSPSGNILASASSDKRINLHRISSLNGSDQYSIIKNDSLFHNGTIYGLEWIDENSFATCSADKTFKVWKLSDDKVECICHLEFEQQCLGMTINRQTKECIVVLLNGVMQVVDVSKLEKSHVKKEITGHTYSIQQLFYHNSQLISVDKNGNVYADLSKLWRTVDESSTIFINDKSLVAFSFGNLMLFNEEKELSKIVNVDSVTAHSNTLWYSSSPEKNIKKLNFDNFKILKTIDFAEECQTMTCNDEFMFAYSKSKSSISYFLSDGTLKSNLKVSPSVQTMSISSDSKHLAVGYQNGLIQIFTIKADNLQPFIEYEWKVHCGIVWQIIWLDENRLVSCSLDGNIIWWSLNEKMKWKIQTNSHIGSVNCLCIDINDTRLLYSGGKDGCIKKWENLK